MEEDLQNFSAMKKLIEKDLSQIFSNKFFLVEVLFNLYEAFKLQ